ncbi:phosphoribosylpyrophosphate synthetase [Aquimarina atlantica]|uniref:Phosphoribosylpyrophosphate synthetase n=1 Tax=Aquimarina atlantica TaxID=1317122 RepID=A0A023BTF4_9FLAO|nr:ribose-phosphate diphosphokinase [Aquimarina atlantica]EZH73224.1 phosphoribosylpyrophosphate synthetase [Aquimarina atlantica]
MRYLHLDPSFTPFEKSIDFKSFVFNGGEPHINILDKNIGSSITITQRINSFNDLGLLLIATDALRRMNVKEINVFIPYFPAARQDRVMVAGESLSVKVYADSINAQHYNQVTIFDPHSEVTPALLDRVHVVQNYEFVKQCLDSIKEEVVLISPDGGALKKIYKVSEFLGGVEVVECSKKRNVKTGALSGFRVYENDLKGKHCVIVDDICDGGGTFLGLATALKEKNAGKLSLIISHGIFSKGFTELTKQFDTIFTTNSFRDVDEEKVVQIPVIQE